MWQRKKLTYDICVPPVSKPLYLFTSEETKKYFDWFVDAIPERISYLSKRCAKDLHINEKEIDLSPDSLLLIWKWFLKIADKEKTQNGNWQMDLQTEYIIRDIGMYLGEVFIKNNKRIHWDYYEEPKTDFFVNTPVLSGFVFNSSSPPFHAYFEPIHMVGVQACHILDNRAKENELLDLYNLWVVNA